MTRSLVLILSALIALTLTGCRHRRAKKLSARQSVSADQYPPAYPQEPQYQNAGAQQPPPPPPPPETPYRAQGPMLSHGQQAVRTGIKHRVAVVAFRDVAQYQGFSGDRRLIAAAAADVVTEALHNSGAFIVVEREQLGRVINEQSLGASGVVNPKSAAKMGQVLGVEAIITGTITDLNVIHSQSGFGGYYAKDSVKYQARVSLKVTDATTGETWAMESGEGDAIQSSAVILGGGKATQDDTLGKKALYAAINSMMGKIVATAANKPWTGTVASVSRGKIYVTGGSEIGVPVGSTLIVRRPGAEIVDPTTGQSLGRESGDDMGTLQITGHMNNKLTTCAVVNGKNFAPGDLVSLQ